MKSAVPCNETLLAVLQCPKCPRYLGQDQPRGGLGEASLCVCGFVLLLVMTTAASDLSCLTSVSTHRGMSYSVHLPLREECFFLSTSQGCK